VRALDEDDADDREDGEDEEHVHDL
jgi:hypothetical protein